MNGDHRNAVSLPLRRSHAASRSGYAPIAGAPQRRLHPPPPSLSSLIPVQLAQAALCVWL